MRYTSKLKKIVLFCRWYIDKCINYYSRVKAENIMKLKHYMHTGLSIYQKIQSPISGQNNITTPDLATNPLLLQNCN